MAQVIAWSWRLLDAPAQLLLGALTQFPSDAGVAAVAAVVDMPVAAAAALLDDLVAHSLVRTAIATDGAADGAPRFGLVEPVREFVAAWLPAAQAHGMRARLRGWLIAWARALGPSAAPTRVAPELATVHAVLAGAAAAGAPRDALALALALRNYWEADTLPGGILVALEAALAAVDDAPTRADVLELLAYLRFEAGFVAQAQAHAEAAITAAGSDPSRRARALVRRAWVEIAVGRGDTEATPRHARLQTRLQEALELARSCADREAQARALQQLAVLAMQVERNVAKAEALFEQSQALWLALGDRRKAYARLRNRAQCWTRMGRQADATAAYAACEQAARDDGDWVGQIDTLLSQSALLAWQHHWPEALAAYRSCVALCWQRWHRHGLGYALWNPPRLLARLRQPEPAMRLIGFAATFWAVQFGPLSTADLRYVRRVRGLVRAQVGAARTEALWLEGASMDLAAAVALALRA
jgi:tetratricopeptide (TPR) repeat protein